MLYIGSHVGFSKEKQLLGSVEEALSYNANTFMFYTGAPQNSRRLPLEKSLTEKAITLMQENNIDLSHVIVHAPYIINLANNDPEKHDFAISFLKQEIERCDELQMKYLVLHPGSHIGLGESVGLDSIVNGLNKVLKDYTGNLTILLETMAGKGTELGKTTKELKYIIDNIENKTHIGVCLDTCHLNDSGIDISKFDDYLDEFDKEIGLDRVHCIHINDSKNEINTHKDRHENIGFGTIGFNNLINVIYNERLENITKILETPYVDKLYPPYKYEIEMIKEKTFDNNILNKIRG